MNKYLLILVLIIAVVDSYSMEQDDSVVPNASYVIYEGDTGVPGGVPHHSRYVTFYSSCGDLIKKIEHNFDFQLIEKRLDSAAPKPQPTKYKIKHCPGISLGFGFKSEPRDFVVFYDKNGNKIDKFLYDKNNDEMETTIFSETVNHKKYKLQDLLVDSNSFLLDLSNLHSIN